MKALQKTNYKTIAALLEQNKAGIAAALPRHLTPERIMKVALSELRTNPSLLDCDPHSLVSSIVKASQLGLEVGGALGAAYLVPFGREATLIVGYRGLIQLARRSGEILSLTARVVYERDTFELEYGLEEKLRHVPSTDQDPGPITHAYAVAKLSDGGVQFDVMTRAEIDAIRSRSRAGRSGPWVTDYAEMARKTVVRRLAKYLPLSIEMADALTADQDVLVEKEVAGSVVDDLNASILGKQEPEPKEKPEPAILPDVDADNAPHHDDWHSTPASLNADGTWRKRRGRDEQAYQRWLEGLRKPVNDPQTAPEPEDVPKPAFAPEKLLERIQKAQNQADLSLLLDRAELALEEGDIDKNWYADLKSAADKRFDDLGADLID